MKLKIESLMVGRHLQHLYEKMGKEVCQKQNMLPIERDIIAFFYNNPKYDTATQLSEVRGLPKSNVSQAVEKLILRGWLLRTCDGEDRRVIHLRLTEEGKKQASRIRVMQKLFEKKVLECFTEEEQDELITLLNRLTEHLRTEEKKVKK